MAFDATPPPAADPAFDIREPQHRVERRAIAWWALRALIAWGILLGGLIAAAIIWQPARVWLIAPIAIVGLTLIVKLTVEPWWRYAVHRWEVTDHATYATTGWLIREWRVAPISRIQTVDAVRGPLEQLMGLATLRVTTASSSGAIDIKGLNHSDAQRAATQLAQLAEIIPGDAT